MDKNACPCGFHGVVLGNTINVYVCGISVCSVYHGQWKWHGEKYNEEEW